MDKLSVPCPECGELSEELLQRIMDNDVIPCALCGGLIDLSAEECSSVVTQVKSRLAIRPIVSSPKH